MNDSGMRDGMEAANKVGEPKLPIPFAEFIALMALLMALTALSIDIMLPALQQIGDSFSRADSNDRQLVLVSYFVGLAAGQLVFGPLADRFGRKPMLLAGLIIYAVGTLSVLLTSSFVGLLAARAVQGFGGASPRVVSLAIIRDYFSGWQMARVMSIVMMVFIVVPVFAPALGQAMLHLGDWRWLFEFLLVIGLISIVWSSFRLPNEHRPQGGPRISIVSAFRVAMTSRVTVAYAMAAGCAFGCLVAYISSAQQVFVDIYGLGDAFPIVFGMIAGVMIFASFANAKLVGRYGMRRVSHSAVVALVGVSLLLALSTIVGTPLWLFAILMAAAFFAIGMMLPNFNAIAMQPMGQVAGTASSFIGFYTTASAALFGWMIGSYFDGSIRPLAIGFVLLSLATVLSIVIGEGRNGLFRGE